MKFSFGKNEKTLKVVAPVAEKSAEEKVLDRLFDLTESNKQVIGGKVYANIPVELLKLDELYQRTNTYNLDTVRRLTLQFDLKQMDTLIVSVHEEEKRYYIMNGMHRFLAATAKGIDALPCEIQFIDGDVETRRKVEANYFISQQILVDKMSPLDQHKAHVILGDQEYVDLDDIVNNTDGIQFKKNRHKGRQPKGTLTGYAQAVIITEKYGKTHMQNVIDILIGARWNEAGTGLSNYSLRMVSDVLAVHNTAEVKAEITRVLRQWDPKLFRAIAWSHYTTRTQGNANALFLEDHVCTNLNIPRLIDKEVTERFNPNVA